MTDGVVGVVVGVDGGERDLTGGSGGHEIVEVIYTAPYHLRWFVKIWL